MSNRNFKSLPLLLIVVMALSAVGCGTQIPSGHRGVFFAKFGSGTEFGKVYREGFNWHMPYNSIFVYKVQIQESKESLTVLSSDGATLRIEVSILYRPQAEKLDSLQVVIGQNYYQVSIAPAIRGVARSVAGRYTPEQIYSTKREEVAQGIIDALRAAMADKYVVIENVVMRDVAIPAKISEAINEKLAMAQEAERMKFTIEREKLEADRKKIEAQGIADFQRIISQGITPSYLKWKGIETTEMLAKSPNSKIVIIGNGANSLPIILSGD